MKRQSLWFSATFLMAVTIASSASAQLSRSLPFSRRVNSDPALDLNLTDRHGPWLIMCASFLGERGEQQARQLALELRRDHNLESYIYRHAFDYSTTIRGKGWQPPKSKEGLPVQVKMKAANPDSFEEVAVVVGNFPSFDDAQAQKSLKRIKYLRPRTIEIKPHVETNQRMAGWREYQKRAFGSQEVREKGPMFSAFLMPNPHLPEDYFKRHTVDKLVLKMNKGIRHSLFDCPGRFTVRVATFRGVTLDAKEIDKKQREFQDLLRFRKPMRNSQLAEGANKANILCKELRKKGVEAYEFHDRYESYVCIGSFNWATRKLPNGKDQLNPEVAKVIKEYKAQTKRIPGIQQMVILPKTMKSLKGKKINFDAQPMPVIVPKMHVSTRQFGR